ncbi:RING-type E3 ubiquitin transferase [Malassezia sp. CBS 17886]|nr:RING-type E3 ubiquitin transferase [Malassezia sp. CBS 17886]
MPVERDPARSTSAPGESSTTRTLPDPRDPAPNLDPVLGFTAQDLIDQQDALEKQAHDALPFSITTCTHALGYIRQPVYACRTCGGGGTPERAPHTADTAYPRDAHPCALRRESATKGWDVANDENCYTRNFDGHFCICARGRSYDPETEDEVRAHPCDPLTHQAMLQCLVCEEWYHESCTSLGEPSAPRPPFEVDAIVCDGCMTGKDADILRAYAGTSRWYIAAPGESSRRRTGSPPTAPPATPARANASDCQVPQRTPPENPRKHRLDEDTCTRPRDILEVIRTRLDKLTRGEPPSVEARIDCAAAWAPWPYVMEDEETYDPPAEEEDSVSTTSTGTTYDRALAALQHLPRPQVIESLRAYQDLRDALYEHLRPFAESHEPVSAAAVQTFFREHAAKRTRR